MEAFEQDPYSGKNTNTKSRKWSCLMDYCVQVSQAQKREVEYQQTKARFKYTALYQSFCLICLEPKNRHYGSDCLCHDPRETATAVREAKGKSLRPKP